MLEPCPLDLLIVAQEGPRSYDFEEQRVEVLCEGGRWEARVTGPLAVLACPCTGVKVLRAEGEEEARVRAAEWITSGLGQADEEM